MSDILTALIFATGLIFISFWLRELSDRVTNLERQILFCDCDELEDCFPDDYCPGDYCPGESTETLIARLEDRLGAGSK